MNEKEVQLNPYQGLIPANADVHYYKNSGYVGNSLDNIGPRARAYSEPLITEMPPTPKPFFKEAPARSQSRKIAPPVNSGFHNLIAFLEQDHGEVVPLASVRPSPSKEVAMVEEIMKKDYLDNLRRAAEKRHSITPAVSYLTPVTVGRPIHKREKERVREQAFARGQEEDEIKSIWGNAPVSPSSPPYPRDVSPAYIPVEYRTGNLSVPSEPYRRSRFTQATANETRENVIRFLKAEHYGNLKPPVVPLKPKFSLIHPTLTEGWNDKLISPKRKPKKSGSKQPSVHKQAEGYLKNLVSRHGSRQPVPPTPDIPTPPTVVYPKAKVKAVVNEEEKRMRRIKRLKKEFEEFRVSGKPIKGNVAKKKAELANLELPNHSSLIQLGKSTPKSKVTKSKDIQKKTEERVSKKIEKEQKKLTSVTRQQDERRLLRIQQHTPTPDEEVFLHEFKQKYGSIPNLLNSSANKLGGRF
jgi:hypothetical protein